MRFSLSVSCFFMAVSVRRQNKLTIRPILSHKVLTGARLVRGQYLLGSYVSLPLS